MHCLVNQLFLASCATIISASPAAAQVEAPVRDTPAPRGQAGYSTTHALTGVWRRVEVYTRPSASLRLPSGRPWLEHVVRSQSGIEGGAETVEWTTSADCPALGNILIWMGALVAPRIDIPGIAPDEAAPEGRRPLTMYADGLSTTVWGYGVQPDHTANTRVEITSNGGLIAQFGRAANEALEPCWSTARPAGF